ncbi:MAG: magnesium/cobalt transporter CorA [Candidatus Cloacimonetes bacterium]|nr:magnesium/cobalt transporter CorA [Candidatus Cloacimonadota bacterium]
MTFFKTQLILNRKKQDPNKFIYTGKIKDEQTTMQLITYNKTEINEKKDISLNDLEILEKTHYSHWLNINGLYNTDYIVDICKKLNIHNLAIQDILDLNQRPKYQKYENFLFLTLKSFRYIKNEIISEQISFIINKNHLISFQENTQGLFDHIRLRIREDKGIIRERGIDYLLYTLLESIFDNYFQIIFQIENEIEKFNFFDSNKTLTPDILLKIDSYKKTVTYIKKSILPIKDFTVNVENEKINYIEPKHIKYFLEIKDICLTIIDNSDMLLSSLDNSINLFFSIQGHKMNEIMKTLTIVATIFIPLTFIAGVYGMNFSNMPELGFKYGYFIIMLIFLIIFIIMIIFFKKKKWF